MKQLLQSTNPPGLLVDSLLLLSQLARISKDYYEPIDRAEVYAEVCQLLDREFSVVLADRPLLAPKPSICRW